MPNAVKISELPVLSNVLGNDLLPIVDSGLTQTHRCTASQIAALGGGPPGANTVNNTHMQDGAVTASKTQFTAPDRLFSRTASGAGQGVEITCTPYARGLLATANGTDARSYLNALQSTNSPVFTGQVQVGKGSVAVPSIVPSTALDTGLFFPEEGVISFASTNQELFRLANDGSIFTPIAGVAGLVPSVGARAWVCFNGFAAAGTNFSIVGNQVAVGRRYGRTGTIGDNATTRAYLATVETARGLTLTLPTTPSFADSKGKGTFPRYNLGTETRANFTTPGDNTHWIWSGSAWVTTPASTIPWIGTLTVSTPPSASPIFDAVNISSISRQGTGQYRCNFEIPMPDTFYCALATASNVNISIVAQTTNYVEIHCFNSAGTQTDPVTVNVAVFH